MEEFKIVPEKGHFVVYQNGTFYCSSDTYEEAKGDIRDYYKMKL